MRMTMTFGMNQIISHGFGLFLFLALVPMMQQELGFDHWFLATAGAMTQLAYVGGALLLGVIGPRIDTGKLVLTMGGISSLLLFSLALQTQPILILVTLVFLAMCAALSWGGIVELVTRLGRPDQCATSLSTIASGTAWGYGVNGLLLLLLVPTFGWRGGWIAAGCSGLVTLFLTWQLLRSQRSQAVTESGSEELTSALTGKQLLRAIVRERNALSASLVCLLMGFVCMSFSTWLNTWLVELQLPSELGGYSWTVIGATGMVAGVVMGKLADRKGHGVALSVITGAYALGMLAFVVDPARFALLAAFSYGLMYFPIWGIVAGWVNKHYSSRATMQINGIGMVAFGLGGAFGNFSAGWIQQSTGSLASLFVLIAFISVVLMLLALSVWLSEGRIKATMEPML